LVEIVYYTDSGIEKQFIHPLNLSQRVSFAALHILFLHVDFKSPGECLNSFWVDPPSAIFGCYSCFCRNRNCRRTGKFKQLYRLLFQSIILKLFHGN